MRILQSKSANFYDERGLSIKVTLLRELISHRLEDCDTMQDYISRKKSSSIKLAGIGFKMDDEWLGALMLAGLTSEFQPLIMGIEANNEKISSDLVTLKLIDVKLQNQLKAGALVAKAKVGKKNKKKFIKKCYTCGSTTHISKNCDSKGESSGKDKKQSTFIAMFSNAVS